MAYKRPLIGVAPMYNDEKSMTYIKPGYIEGIMEAGGTAVLLPVVWDEVVLRELADRCDGILLPGGPDLDAKHFGERNLPFNGEISPVRDFIEMHLAYRTVEQRKPLLGICRGMQVMNAALGGTIYQDIGSQVRGRELLKHVQEAPKWYPTHEIFIKRNDPGKGSMMQRIFGDGTVGVNSFHHQAIRDVAPGFAVTSTAADGMIESIEHELIPFAVGVQWHPELMWQRDRTHLSIFEEFVKAAAGKL